MADVARPSLPLEGVAPETVRASPAVVPFALSALWLGCIGFGGGYTVLAAAEDELVRRRKWLTGAEFAEAASVAQLLPGGAAANALAFAGMQRRGVLGALVGYGGFIAPGALATLGLAVLYQHFGELPRADAALRGINAAVVGVIAGLALRMARSSLKAGWQRLLALASLGLTLGLGVEASLVVALGLAVGVVARFVVPLQRAVERGKVRSLWPTAPRLPASFRVADPWAGAVVALTLAAVLASPWLAGDLPELGRLFLRTGLGAYGGGFAIIPALQHAVAERGWLTSQQFADAVAAGKLTPGPVLLMSTFIGYLHAGPWGAAVATAGIFLGPFALVTALAKFIVQRRRKRWVRAAMAGLMPAVVGLIAGAAGALAGALQSWVGYGLAASAAVALAFFRVNPLLLLALAAVARVAVKALLGA